MGPLLFILMLHLCNGKGFLVFGEKEGLKELLSWTPMELGRGEVLVDKQLVFFSASNYKICKDEGKLLVKYSELLLLLLLSFLAVVA